jgi:PAS domain S-box-containing protein
MPAPFLSSLRIRLLLLIIMAVIPALIYIFYTAAEQRDHKESEIREETMHVARLAANSIEQLIEGAHQVLIGYSKLPAVRNYDSPACNNYFSIVKEQLPMYANIAAVKPNGDVFCSSISVDKKINLSDRLFFQTAIKTRDYSIGEYVIARVYGKPSFALGLPVMDEKRLIAVVYVSLDLNWFKEQLSKIKIYNHAILTVLDRKLTILYRYPDTEKAIGENLSSTELTRLIGDREEGIASARSNMDGIERIWAFTKVPGTGKGMSVRYGISREVAFADINQLLIKNLLVLLIITCVSLTIAWYGGNYFVMRRMRTLTRATDDLAAGNLSVRVDREGHQDEISRLGDSFNKMAESLERHVDKLEGAEEELRLVTQRLQLATQAAKLGIWDWNITNNKMHWDGRMLELYGLTPETFSEGIEAWQKGLHPEDRDRTIEECQAALRGEKEWDTTFRVLHPDGIIKHIKANGIVVRDSGGTPIRMLGVNFDITEHVNLEAQVRQSQKIESIGTLAGGVAHDFNNILSTIVGYSHLSLMKMGVDDPNRHNLEQILASSDRAVALTQSLLAFSRKQPISLARIDLNDVIVQFEKFLHRLLREDIELKTILAPKELPVLADRGQVEQVLMNLMTNARDATPQGGRIIIETGLIELEQSFIKAHGFGREGAYALLSVTDTGVGIPKNIQNRIFDPFFTTKEEGKGTGLGLSMAYGIVKKHEGYINVYSQHGVGTTFKIYLPVTHVPADAEQRKNDELDPVRGGTETVLIAEDDASLRELTATLLRRFGYTVIEAADGKDAVAKFMENRDIIRLVILDGIMPKMNGKAAWMEIKALSFGIKAIFISGYAEDIFTKEGIFDKEASFIQKPYPPLVLAKRVRELLDK